MVGVGVVVGCTVTSGPAEDGERGCTGFGLKKSRPNAGRAEVVVPSKPAAGLPSCAGSAQDRRLRKNASGGRSSALSTSAARGRHPGILPVGRFACAPPPAYALASHVRPLLLSNHGSTRMTSKLLACAGWQRHLHPGRSLEAVGSRSPPLPTPINCASLTGTRLSDPSTRLPGSKTSGNTSAKARGVRQPGSTTGRQAPAPCTSQGPALAFRGLAAAGPRRDALPPPPGAVPSYSGAAGEPVAVRPGQVLGRSGKGASRA